MAAAILERRKIRNPLERTLRRMIRRSESGISVKEAKAIRLVLSDSRAFDKVLTDVYGLALFKKGEPGVATLMRRGADDDDSHPFLNWLWENREAILAFVLKVIAAMVQAGLI